MIYLVWSNLSRICLFFGGPPPVWSVSVFNVCCASRAKAFPRHPPLSASLFCLTLVSMASKASPGASSSHAAQTCTGWRARLATAGRVGLRAQRGNSIKVNAEGAQGNRKMEKWCTERSAAVVFGHCQCMLWCKAVPLLVWAFEV